MTRQDVPNLLTYLRFALALATFCGLVGAPLASVWSGSTDVAADIVFASLAAFVVCALTDYFDGWLARRWNASSAWGATLDPIADKVAVCAAVLGLIVIWPRVSVIAAGAIILFREIFVAGLREAGAARGVRLPVTALAKWKTTLQLAALSLEIAAVGWNVGYQTHRAAGANFGSRLADLADVALWIAATATVWTGAQYAVAARIALGRTQDHPARTSAS